MLLTRAIALDHSVLATATAVSASGLIGFVGIVVPHLVRGVTHRVTNRNLLTIALAGAAFLVLADLGARTLLSPAELPIGVITAFVGAPFFLVVLRRRRTGSA
jgi:iron complex transport system permease protein